MRDDSQSVKVDEDVLEELDRLAELENSGRNLLFKEAISRGLKDLKMHLAVKAFAEKKATTSEAADIADVSVGEMMDELRKRGLRPEIKKGDLEESLKNARKAIKG
ncbi:hypothetical protein AKJ37_00915 [candidate division MSBL1 archaeon SCGC-AAA259I09]|uniref:Uncharacterized protein n=2 Tax=candidate division MSBL1 TaxID=215777 RepID=A0A133UTP8_9EURY|nr:hypothetical protein AKJ38_00915 [candidate division MSBL1 archaeon SCGC-AAA259I14]KXA98181.1 hypothetical protein AKJ37_00915 [candidate division MSBL1 archaeon SCGC-AAA259I09]